MSFTSDWRFSPERSREIVNALIGAEKSVSYAEVDAPLGHDSFLLPVERYNNLFTAYMKKAAQEHQPLSQGDDHAA